MCSYVTSAPVCPAVSAYNLPQIIERRGRNRNILRLYFVSACLRIWYSARGYFDVVTILLDRVSWLMTDLGGCEVENADLRPLEYCWDRGFESRRGLGCRLMCCVSSGLCKG
jgi:hypothetical protein